MQLDMEYSGRVTAALDSAVPGHHSTVSDYGNGWKHSVGSRHRCTDALLDPLQGFDANRDHPPLRPVEVHDQQKDGSDQKRKEEHRSATAL